MIGLLPTTTIFLATAPTDLRKAYDGLAVLVRQSLGQDPLNGSLYVFCNRRRDRINQGWEFVYASPSFEQWGFAVMRRAKK